MRKLNSELTELRRSQQELLIKYVKNDKHIMVYFDQLDSKLESEIATIEAGIAECDLAKASLDQLTSFSNTLPADIPQHGSMRTSINSKRFKTSFSPAV